ncbi:Ger(x)C family spore germination protein [Desulforamulus ruminis]|uniref:Germination protein, Ger(X)C family n=1 Tax=Desulforamulus ruminis (strain ATCC 23193 / DSM 2154 / NCIMB 8452 / DL) TaxID=696281 RepID=F6DKN9_DESRL|nr:Ger(x)C family spore germination protein [Desulforamulus ruminis]AEG60414.1 germination protein, Ger(x)C family [Desulforamulus ruminis DSM 2154]
MNKKRISFLILILVLVLLSGCWSRREISDLAIVLGAGVDLTPDKKVRITLQLARPSAFSSGSETGGGSQLKQNIVWVVSAVGDTIFEAERKLALTVDRRLYWGHSIILVLGEEMAKQGVRHVTNFFVRNPEPRETAWVFVTRGEAKRVLESHSELERTSAQSAGYLARNQVAFSVILKDFIIDLASKATNPLAPVIELKPEGEPQGPGLEEAPQHEELAITGTGVFKDEKLIGWLDLAETRGLLWLRGEIEKGTITIPSPGEPDKLLSLNVVRAQTKVEPYYDGQTIHFKVSMTCEMNLLEQQSKEELFNLEKIAALERKAEENIIAKSTGALEKAQEVYGVDIFDFGEVFHRKYKKEWKEMKDHWDEEFVNSEVSISAEAKLQSTGLQRRRTSLED